MKLKAKLKGNVAEVKILASHPQMGREEAETKKAEKNYITHVTAKIGDRVVFEASTGPFLSKDPFFVFNTEAKSGDEIVIEYVDLKGATKNASVKLK
ncbi:MAG: thiosulfate oxidation carrier complex protein SoxZ [Sulfurimonas sp.]